MKKDRPGRPPPSPALADELAALEAMLDELQQRAGTAKKSKSEEADAEQGTRTGQKDKGEHHEP